jgi:hypothetical protein
MKHWIATGAFCTGLLATLSIASPRVNTALAASSRSHTAAVTRCYTNQLTISPDTSNSGAGHVGRYFRLHNKSNRGCTLFGYPGAQLLNASGHAMPTVLHWGTGYLSGSVVKRLVYLASGGNAYFLLEWSHIPTPGQTCPGAPAILITPPNTYRSIRVSLGQARIDACGGIINAAPVERTRLP